MKMGQALYYITLGCCVVGCTLRIVLAGYYLGLLHAMKNMKTTKSKWMAKMKEKFILRYQAMLGVQNVETFVGRFLAEGKLLGISLSTWNGLHLQMISLCLLLGAMEAFHLCVEMAQTQEVMMAMFQGLWTSVLLLLVDGFCMISGKVNALRDGMCDYLENYLKVCLEHDYAVWGKNTEELRQTKQVLDAQMQIVDEKNYKKEKKAVKKQQQQPQRRVERDVVMLKKEVAERRKKTAEAAATVEPEKSSGSSQVEELLRELSLEI